jgi:eukaryotic-like serine/threonine-protein kinase
VGGWLVREGAIADSQFCAIAHARRSTEKVAIKLLDGAALSERSLQLFRHEREILANLEHTNIARLLDAGENEDGVPYFVMEYVDGQPIDVYCDLHRLTLEQRLRLFLKVCSAVHYAHQNLVIHRDIKPANILVTESGEPKLLDFGIAKIDDANGNTRTLTAFRVLTPAYASPEQLAGKPLNIATDVYSLGLVLYELLTGRYAYGERQSALELQRAILEEDPQRPSAVILRLPAGPDAAETVEKISAARQIAPQKLRSALLGDLESIVLKAVRKEPSQRYLSVDRLMEDIESYLHGLPVRARQGTVIYKLRKFVLRNRTAVIAGGLICLLLVAGIVLILREARIARMQQARAERRFNDVRQLANSLMFDIHDSISTLPGATSARRLVVSRALEYLDKLSEDTRGDAALEHEMAAAYDRLGTLTGNDEQGANLGDASSAVRIYNKALGIREALLAANPEDFKLQNELLWEYFNLANAQLDSPESGAAINIMQKALPLAQRIVAQQDTPQTQNMLAGVCYEMARALEASGDFNGALENSRRAVAIREAAAARPGATRIARHYLAASYSELGMMLGRKRQYQPAIEMMHKALDLNEQLLKDAADNAAFREGRSEAYDMLGQLLEQSGDLPAALTAYRKAHDNEAQLYSSDSADNLARVNFATTGISVGQVLVRQGRVSQGISYFRQAIQILEPMDWKNTRYAAWGLGEAYSSMGLAFSALAGRDPSRVKKLAYWKEARSWYEKSVPIWQEPRNREYRGNSGRKESEIASEGLARCVAALKKLE